VGAGKPAPHIGRSLAERSHGNATDAHSREWVSVELPENLVQWQDSSKELSGLPIGQMGGPLGLKAGEPPCTADSQNGAVPPCSPAQLHDHSLGLGTSTSANTVRITIDWLSLCAST
jgi:hypothetical protein